MGDRLEQLDSSRGLAALSVVLSHFFGAYGLFGFLTAFEDTSIHLLWHGEGAVTYLYVLSGYVLSISFFKGLQDIDHFDIKSYVVKRIFRIYPLFLGCLVASAVLQAVYLKDIINIATQPERSAWIKEFWSKSRNLFDVIKESNLMILMPSRSSLRLLPQDWTLGVELLISCIVPVFLVMFKKGLPWLAALGVVMFLQNQFVLPFLVGIVLARYNDAIIARMPKSAVARILILLAGIFLYTCTHNFLKDTYLIKDHNHSLRTFVLESLGSGILLLMSVASPTIKSILSNRLLVFLGKISYAIYSSHFFILIFVLPSVVLSLNKFQLGIDSVRALALLFFLTATCLVSFLLRNTVELPFIKIGRRISLIVKTWTCKS
jgi:peptidoglycan/LPS O-acetylase OafA/YrhL